MYHYILHLFSFSMLILADQLSKGMAEKTSFYIINKGVLLNFMGGAPLSIKIISLASFSSLLFLIYLLFLYFIPMKLSKLKVAITFLISGICGNSLDKILRGHTIDFIPFYKSAFNIADIYILSSIAFIVFYIYRHHRLLWVEDDERKFKLVYPKEQFRFAFKFSFIVFASSLLLGTLSLTFIKTYIAPVILESQKVIQIFGLLYGVATVFFIILVFFLGLFFSTKTAGPIYALELFVENLKAGRDVSKFKLREGDNFKELEQIAEELKSFAVDE